MFVCFISISILALKFYSLISSTLSAKVSSHSIIPQAVSLCMAYRALGKKVECKQFHPSTHYQREQTAWAGNIQPWTWHQYLKQKFSHQIWKRGKKRRNYTPNLIKPGQVKFSLLVVILLVSNFDKIKLTPFKQIFEIQEGDFSVYLAPIQVRLDHSLSMTWCP